MLAVLVAAILAACSGGSAEGVGNKAVSYTHPSFGWSIEYPSAWHLRSSSVHLRITRSETTVANFEAATEPPRITTRTVKGGVEETLEGVDRVRDFPADGVVLRILYQAGGPIRHAEGEETRFPVALSDFRPWRYPTPAGTAPRPVSLDLAANSRSYAAFVWIGRHASRHDRRQIERVVSSLRFPRLRVGQTTSSGFYVLGREAAYAVGSVTFYPRSRGLVGNGKTGRGFHLIRTRRGFYALTGVSSFGERGYSDCDVRFDRQRFQFFCPSNGARWDQLGQPLVNPAPRRFEADPLAFVPVVRSHDGHVLIARGSIGSPPEHVRGSLRRP